MTEAIAVNEAVDAVSRKVEESLAAGGDGAGDVAGALGIPGDQLTEVATKETIVVLEMMKDGLPPAAAIAGMVGTIFLSAALWERGHHG